MQHPNKLAEDLATTIINLNEVKQRYNLDSLGDLYEILTGVISARLQFWKDEIIYKCAEKSFKKNVEVAGENEVWEIVKKEDILNIKKKLQ